MTGFWPLTACTGCFTTFFDAAGWRPTKGQRDKYDREIPDDEYHTRDFERTVFSLQSRTEAIARHI